MEMKKRILIISFLVFLALVLSIVYFWLKISQKPRLPEEERFIIESRKIEEIIKEVPQELVDLSFDPQAKLGSGYSGKYSQKDLKQAQIGVSSQLSGKEVFEHYIKVFQDNGYRIIVADAGKDPKIKNIVAKKENHLAVILITEKNGQSKVEIQWKEVE